MEQRATLWLGHSPCLLPADHRPLVSHRLRLGRSARCVATYTSIGVDEAGSVYNGAGRYWMGFLRHLDSLLLALLTGSPRTDAAAHLC